MTDRIKEPWGTRTPFGPGEEWPVRVDQFLGEGLSEEEVDRWVQTASILHSNGDALDIAVKDGRVIGVRGRGVDRVNKGRADPKDLFGWQANNSADRLTRPLVRAASGELVETSWDEAMDRVVERSKELLEEKGPLALGFYTTGQLFLEEYYTLNVIGKAGLGTPHMDGNTRLCTATAAEALKQSYGTDGQPGSYADVDRADTICLYGHNVAETQTVLWMRMLDRLEGPRPPKLVVVDPRPTPPARKADVHLAVKNGTNMALMNGLLHEIIANGWYDEEYVAAHTLGFEELKSVVEGYPPKKVSEICEVPAGQIREAARIIGESERVLSTVLQGFYQSMQATAASCQVNNIHLLRAMIGTPGCGVLQMVVLPAATWGEKTGTFTNADRTVHLSEKAVEPPGEARSDLEIFLDYAQRMDFRDIDGEPLIKWDDPESCFEAWKECSRGRPCDYTGMTYAKLRGESGIQWPCNDEHPDGTERLYADGDFNTETDYCETYGRDLLTGAESTEVEHRALAPNGRAFLLAAEYQPPHEVPDEEYPFSYTTGRTVYHFHTRTKTARAPQLQNAAPDAWVEIHPSDADALGVGEGDVVRVESPRGRLEAKARISGIRQGVVFVPFHYGYFDQPAVSGPNGRPRAANELTITEWDPASKQPLYKVGAVKVTKISDSGGTPAPAPTTTGSDDAVRRTMGGEVAEAVEKEV
jgi:anaerobic selenocysteine-containing dehydrogenase